MNQDNPLDRDLARLENEGGPPAPETGPSIPFSLVCFWCDSGDEIDSAEEAFAAGWTDIISNDGPGWN